MKMSLVIKSIYAILYLADGLGRLFRNPCLNFCLVRFLWSTMTFGLQTTFLVLMETTRHIYKIW